MNIFCDTNIVMEFLQQRTYASQVEQILNKASRDGDTLFISVGSFYTITYLIERYLKAEVTLSKEDRVERLRYILNGVLKMFKLGGANISTITNGVNDRLFSDLEDSYQAHIAEDLGCDVLLTIDEHHFSRYAVNSPVKVMTPESFLRSYLL